jgi:hypothetical protein
MQLEIAPLDALSLAPGRIRFLTKQDIASLLEGIKIVGGSHGRKGSVLRNSGFVRPREFVRFNENLSNIGIDPVLVGCPGKGLV